MQQTAGSFWTQPWHYFTYVTGNRGAGKSIFVASVLAEAAIPPVSNELLTSCKKYVGNLQKNGWTNLSVDPKLTNTVYCNEILEIKNIGYLPRKTMKLDAEKLGLYDGENETQNFLPYSILGIIEFQKVADSRKSMTSEKLTDNKLRFNELVRKFRIRVIVDTQLIGSTDLRYRDMADCIIHVLGKKDKYKKSGEIESTTLFYLEFGSAANYKKFENDKDNFDMRDVKTRVFVGNVYAIIDSYAGEEYFLAGLQEKNFDTQLHGQRKKTKEAMLQYCKDYPLFSKKSEKRDNLDYEEINI